MFDGDVVGCDVGVDVVGDVDGACVMSEGDDDGCPVMRVLVGDWLLG